MQKLSFSVKQDNFYDSLISFEIHFSLFTKIMSRQNPDYCLILRTNYFKIVIKILFIQYLIRLMGNRCWKKGKQIDSPPINESRVQMPVHNNIGVQDISLVVLPIDMTPIIFINTSNQTEIPQQHLTLRIRYDHDWADFFQSHQNSECQQIIEKQIIEKINCKSKFIHLINKYIDIVEGLIREKIFILNLSFQKIINNRISASIARYKINQKHYSLIKVEIKPALNRQNLIQHIQKISKILEQSYGIVQGIIGLFDKPEMLNLSHQNLKNLKDQVQRLNPEDYAEAQPSKVLRIATIIQQWIIRQMTNQFLINCHFLLTKLKGNNFMSEQDSNQAKGLLIKAWKSQQSIQQIQSSIKNFITQNNLQIEKKQKFSQSQIPEISSSDKQQNIFQNSNSSSENREQNASSSKKENSVSKSQSSIQDYPSRTLPSKQQQKQKKFYYKNYKQEVMPADTRYFKMITQIEYIEESLLGCNIRTQKLRISLAQNSMNAVRYLRTLKNRQWIMAFEIKQDLKPNRKQFILHDRPLNSICFLYNGEKGQKQYSSVNREKYITNASVWAFKDRKVIYNFIFSACNIIIFLEQHRIYQADLKFQNFIKIGNQFLMIDFEHIYFSFRSLDEKTDFQNQCQNVNKMIFENWYYSDFKGLELFERQEKKFRKFLQKNKQNLQAGVQLCLDLMFQHMQNSHYCQFYELIQGLFEITNYQIFDYQEEQQIIKLIHQKCPRKYFYEDFIEKLQKIQKKFNKDQEQIKYGKIGLNYQFFSRKLTRFSQSPYLQLLKKKYALTVSNFKKNNPPCIIKYQSIQRCQNDDHIIYLKNGLENTNSSSIGMKARKILNALLSILEIIQFSEQGGWLLLNLGFNNLAQVGEVFKLKDHEFIFKIKYDKIDNESRQDKHDKGLVNTSVKLLISFIFDPPVKNFFSPQFLEKVRIFHLYRDYDDPNQLAKFEQMNKQIKIMNYPILTHQQNKEVPLLKPLAQEIHHLIVHQTQAIHYQQFKRLASEILYFGQQVSQLAAIKYRINQYIEAKEMNNYLRLQEQLPKLEIIDSYSIDTAFIRKQK